jgi:hypothetical protein
MRYLLCLIEQGLISVLNIGLNLWLIRIGGGELFGVYAFWFNVALLAGSVQNGLTICHLAPLPPGPGTAPPRQSAEQALMAASLVLVAGSGVLVAGAVGVDHALSGAIPSATIVYVPAYLAYQYARALAFSRGALVTATVATTLVTVITAAGLAADYLLMSGTTANRVMLITALGYGVAGTATTWHLAAGLRLRLGHLRGYLPYASISRWSVLGIACFEATNRLPSFAVAGWYGAAALGRMSTTQIPTRVPILLVAALQPALRNDLARRLGDGDWKGFASDTLRGGLLAFAANAVWAVPVGLAWSFLARWLFHGRFTEDADLGMLWATSQTLGSVINVAATAFQVCGAFRLIGIADIGGAAGTLLGLAVLMPRFGVAGTIGAIAVGQACYLAVTIAQWPRLKRGMPSGPARALAAAG